MSRDALKETYFNFDFDFDEPVYPGFTDGTHWNGFANVWCTVEVRKQIAEFFKVHGQEKEYYDEFMALPVDDGGLVCLAGGYATVERIIAP